MEIVSNSIAIAWANAFLSVMENGSASPLTVTVDVSTMADEEGSSPIFTAVDQFLTERSDFKWSTTASTIFPITFWNRTKPRQLLFDRYKQAWPKIKRTRANQYGTYFQRMISYGSDTDGVDQLSFVIETWKAGNHRRSALQVGILDPKRDHVNNRRRGFPCLQQVALVPLGVNGSNGLVLSAYYPLEYIVDRGLGNYVGLFRLGQFLAYEMGLQLVSLTIVASVVEAGKHRVGEYQALQERIRELL